jgi:hypothetical protein
MYIKQPKRNNADWLETRDEWELEIERGQNRGSRQALGYDDEDYDEDLDSDSDDDTWLCEDLKEMAEGEEEINWDEL